MDIKNVNLPLQNHNSLVAKLKTNIAEIHDVSCIVDKVAERTTRRRQLMRHQFEPILTFFDCPLLREERKDCY